MSLKTRLSKLEKKINRLPDIDVTNLSDDELNNLADELDEKLAKEKGWEYVHTFNAWIESLPEEELDRLINDTSYLISENRRLGLN